MALTHEQAGHLLHPTMWFSAANSSLVLTSDWSDSPAQFSTPVTEQWNYYGRPGRYAWLAVASVDSSLDPGVGGLFKMPDGSISTPATWWGFEAEDISGNNPWLQFVDLSSNGTMGGVNGAPPRLNSNQQLEFERIHDYVYVIRIAGTQLCLTAGPSPSANPTSGDVTLAPYEGAANQIWECYGSSSLIGFYDLRSYASNGSLVITTPGDVPTNLVQLGLASPRPESISQTYRLIEPSLDPSQAPRKFIAQQARGPQFVFNLGLAQTGVWTVCSINQLVASGSTRSILRAPETSSESWSADSISYDALHLSFHNYCLDTAGPERVPFSGGLWGADSYPESPQQAWIPVPRNVYDAGLPTPSALSVIVENEDFGETVETTSRCSLSIGETIREASCTLKFALSRDHEFFQIGVAERYMQDDDTWSDWTSYIRTPGVAETTSLEPGWGVAWVPNAFAASADTDGRMGIDVTGVSLSANRPRIQMRYTIRAFEYSDAGVPTVGPASTIIIDFSAKGHFENDGSPMVGIDGLHVPYSIDYFTGPTRLHFDSVMIGRVEAIRDFDTSVSSASGTLLVPWTAFSNLDAAWMRASGTMIQIFGESSDLFGTSSIATGRALIADEDATVVAGTMSSNPIFTSISTGIAGKNKIFCVVDSESGQRVIEMPGVVTPPALDYATILDGEQQQTTRALIITSDDILGIGSEYHAASFDIPRPSRCVTTLAYDAGDGIVIIAVEGNISSGFSLSRDISTARRVGANAFELGALPGASTELELRGVLYRGQLASFPVSSSQSVKIASTIQEACRIPADTTCVLRTAYGTCHRVRVIGVSAPRSSRDQVEITFSLVEVDD